MRIARPAVRRSPHAPILHFAVVALTTAVVLVAGCTSGSSTAARSTTTTSDAPRGAPVSMTLTSTSFSDGGTIPTRSTCDGRNQSPPLAWTGVPAGAVTLALTTEDPDAPGGTFVHWVLWGLPATVHGLDEGAVPEGALEGVNGAGRRGYMGPCPPKGNGAHRYVFTVYALSEPVSLAPGATIAQLRAAMDGSILAEGRLTGRYAR
jgi:Raf kinase inhibitor-like YbhB/YbcL family protein